MGMIAKTAARKADATCLLVDVIVQVVTDVCLAVKGLLQVPRPCDSWGHYGKHVPALVPVPAFTAYPGGHAAVMAALLWFVADVTGAKPDEVDKLSLLGARIAGNRESAGLHIPSDTAAGWALGTHVARCLREMAKPGGQYKNWNAVFEAACSEW
jgi:membrane-associated phospholipid phosphatase